MGRRFLSFILLGVFSVFAGCGDFLNSLPPSPPEVENNRRTTKNPFPPGFENPNLGEFSEQKMLVNVGLNVIARQVKYFRLQAELLAQKAANGCSKMNLEETKKQWRETMLAFHSVDAVGFGPLVDRGRYLVDNIYSWPLLDQCGIDREVVRFDESKVNNDRLLYTSKGLGALEYLLFEPTLNSKCNANSYPATARWSARPLAEKISTRCALVAPLANDVVGYARQLDEAWDPNEGNHSKNLIDGNPPYSSLKEATNALTDGLFSLEKTKDSRLGKVLGLNKDCTSESGLCPDSMEHPFSDLGLEALSARINSFEATFFGSSDSASAAFGLDDLLIARGHRSVADRIRQEVQRARASLEALQSQGTYSQLLRKVNVENCRSTTIEDRKEPVCAFFHDVRVVAATLKIDVLTVLALRSPPDFQGDND